jgi:hypothetical protein
MPISNCNLSGRVLRQRTDWERSRAKRAAIALNFVIWAAIMGVVLYALA